jgi:hypothetical protein
MTQDVRPILDGYREIALDDAEALKFVVAEARREPTLENCRRLKWKLELVARSLQTYIEKELSARRIAPNEMSLERLRPQPGSAS